MRQRELLEIQHRASLIAEGSINTLHNELRSLHARHAAQGCLRSGKTIKESARIAAEVIRAYFNQLEAYVRELPGGGDGSDAAIVDGVSASTAKLLNEMWESLRKTAALASDAKLVVHIQPQLEAELLAAQEAFRSNLRVFWAQHGASQPRGSQLLLASEIVLFAAALGLAVAWVANPAGPYEAWMALSGVGGLGIDIYRRRANAGAP